MIIKVNDTTSYEFVSARREDDQIIGITPDENEVILGGDIPGIDELFPQTEDEARAKRDKLLFESDWTQTLDAPIDEATRTAYRAYRQALRDVPQQEGFPASIVWPELPARTKAAPEPVDEAVELLLSGATGEEASA